VRPLVRVSLTVIVEEGGRREQGTAGGGGRFDYGYFTDAVLETYADRRSARRLLNLERAPTPGGTMTVVLGHGWPGILLHEAIGHGLEGDFNRKGRARSPGASGSASRRTGIT
jgi:TldD protein